MTVEEWLGEDNQLGIDIWKTKYADGDETFDHWLERVSGGNENVKELIKEKKFLFGGRILANRGLASKNRKLTYSNCYVTSTDDSIEDIFETAKKIARTFSYGGGIGVDISPLAPKGATVHNAAKTSSGAVSFMDLYSCITGIIGQQGRRGALMLSMDCSHPDIEDFINVKNDLNKVNFANISVRASDEFMEAVRDDKEFTLYHKRKDTGDETTKTVRARDLFHQLAVNNWRTGEPGMLFWDKIKNYNILSNDPNFEYAGTNPCGEEPLPNGGSCCLGSINLSEFVVNPFSADAYFDIQEFRYAVSIAVDAMNEVLDEGMKLHPLQEQRDSVEKWRQIGVGIMGLADMLVKLNMRYGDKSSVELCDKIAKEMACTAIKESAFLAEEHGKYPAYSEKAVLNSQFIINNLDDRAKDLLVWHGLRNSQLLTIAPTGTLSTMLGVSGGIEPIFANSYERTTKTLHGGDHVYKVYTPIVKKFMDEYGITDEKDLPACFITAHEINPGRRIAMQAAWQKHIDASISSTINLPNSTTPEEIESIYMGAWENGLKGVTVFREGCERASILTTGSNSDKKSDDEKPAASKKERGSIKPVDNTPIGLERHLTTGCGSLHCSAFFDRNTGELLETYLSKGSKGGCLSSLSGLSRMISLASRGGIGIEDVVDQLKSSIECPSYSVRRATKKDTSVGNCCPAAVGNALMSMYNEMQDMIKNGCASAGKECSREEEHDENVNKCPQCGEELVAEGGCVVCKACGWSRCG